MVQKIALEIKNVSKSFKLPTEKSNGIKNSFINWMKGRRGFKMQHVLHDVSFTVDEGDFFGIVGRNGSGKSTLLKLISSIYVPDNGKISVNGSLVPFIELGVGFNPELTGRENVYLNSAMLGFSNDETDEMYDDIVNFAELHEFMDQKLKNYSSGMQVRLAFSVAIKAQGDILVLDEVLAVGDEAFQRKCYAYFAELKRHKKTVILVTHSMDAVQQFCNKALMIEKGEIVKLGNTAEIAQLYRELFMGGSQKAMIKTERNGISNRNIDINTKLRKTDDKLTFDVRMRSKVKTGNPEITFVIRRDNGELVYRWTSGEKIAHKLNLNTICNLRIGIENIFPNGIFDVQIAIREKDRTKDYAIFDNIISFEIINKGSHPNDIYWKPKEEYRIDEIAQ
ncbi:ABC transporter ATP-binding protein [Candidatus Saccharibacteria bacterium]|nr:ABC transporter ATP-binding protein [Candidatus Saccharibacteria bacterium]